MDSDHFDGFCIDLAWILMILMVNSDLVMIVVMLIVILVIGRVIFGIANGF